MKRDEDYADEDLRAAANYVEQRRYRRRREQRIADVIGRLLARRGYAQVDATVQLDKHWSQLVGEPLSSFSRPAALRRGVLTVAARNSMTVQELTIRKQELLNRIQKSEFGQAIKDLRFRVSSFEDRT